MSDNQHPCEPLEWEQQFVSLLETLSVEARLKKDKTMAKYHALIAIGGFTGARPKVLLELSWTDVLDKNSDFFLENKTNDERKTGFNKALEDLLKKDFLFIDPVDPELPILHNRKGRRITTQSFNSQFKKYLEQFEIYTKNPSALTLRKTYGHGVWELGGKSMKSLLEAQNALGIRTLEYTMDYLGITPEIVEESL